MTGLRHDGMGGRYGGALGSYFEDISRRLREMGLTMMGATYALGPADLYRRAVAQLCERVATAHLEFDQSNHSVG